ncbi:MAG: TonB-dependent receptor, partial [Kordiimonas sp.]
SLQLTTRWGWSRYHSFTDRLKFQPDENVAVETFDSDRNSRYFEGEVGVDWTQPIGSHYKWRVIALASGQHWTVVSPSVIEDHVNESDRKSDYRYERNKFEGIFRTLFSDVSTSKFKPEFGVEIAYNRADFDIDLVSISEGVRTPVVLPASDVLVEELRGEAFANAIWQATSALSFEAGMALEVSNITTSGNAGTSQTLSYLKPSAAIVYSFSDKLQTRLSYSRTVGQLDFSDFAASADFESDREFGGNPALRPHRSSKLSATTKWSFGKGGALQLDVYHERRNGVLEQVILPSGAFGIGAAGNAKINGIDVSLTAPIERLIPGGQVEVIAKTVSSKFDDPVTGIRRNLTNEAKPELEFKFRQDMKRYPVSWGGSFKINTDETNYYIDEISTFTDRDRFEGFVETTIASGLKVRFDFVRAGSYLDRQFFDPTRAGSFSGREVHDRKAVNAFTLTVSGQF